MAIINFQDEYEFYLPASLENGSICLYTGKGNKPLNLLTVPCLRKFSFNTQLNLTVLPRNSGVCAVFKDRSRIVVIRRDSTSIFRTSDRLLLQSSIHDVIPFGHLYGELHGLCIINNKHNGVAKAFVVYGNTLYICLSVGSLSVYRLIMVDLSVNDKSSFILRKLYNNSSLGESTFFVTIIDDKYLSINISAVDLGVYEYEEVADAFSSFV